MNVADTPASGKDALIAAHVAASIARAERRRERLELLADVGTALAKEITIRMIEGPYHPELRHDPGRSYAAVMRALRLTMALEAKIDEQILAWLNGAVSPPSSAKSKHSGEPGRSAYGAQAADPNGRDNDEASADASEPAERLVEYDRADPADVDVLAALTAGLDRRPPAPTVDEEVTPRLPSDCASEGRDIGRPGEIREKDKPSSGP